MTCRTDSVTLPDGLGDLTDRLDDLTHRLDDLAHRLGDLPDGLGHLRRRLDRRHGNLDAADLDTAGADANVVADLHAVGTEELGGRDGGEREERCQYRCGRRKVSHP